MPHLLICLKFADSRGTKEERLAGRSEEKKADHYITKSAAGMDEKDKNKGS